MNGRLNKFLLVWLVAAFAGTPAHAQIFADSFNYPDGPITSVSGGIWTTYSGAAGELTVANGRAQVTEAKSEDVRVQLPGGPYSSGNLYASFVVNFSALPSGAGNSFVSFLSSAIEFRARVYATTVGAGGGAFRLGIANQAALASAAAFVPTDLALNTDYRVVIRYSGVGSQSAGSTLWIDPSAEADVGNRTDAGDAFIIPSSPMASFALRESLFSGNGMGTLALDDLKIGTDFASVVPEPPSTILMVLLVLGWRFLDRPHRTARRNSL